MNREQTAKARSAKAKHEREWLAIDAVSAVGVGVREGEVCIIISVDTNPASLTSTIPAGVDDIPVVVERRGRIEPL